MRNYSLRWQHTATEQRRSSLPAQPSPRVVHPDDRVGLHDHAVEAAVEHSCRRRTTCPRSRSSLESLCRSVIRSALVFHGREPDRGHPFAQPMTHAPQSSRAPQQWGQMQSISVHDLDLSGAGGFDVEESCLDEILESITGSSRLVGWESGGAVGPGATPGVNDIRPTIDFASSSVRSTG